VIFDNFKICANSQSAEGKDGHYSRLLGPWEMKLPNIWEGSKDNDNISRGINNGITEVELEQINATRVVGRRHWIDWIKPFPNGACR